MTPAPCSVMTRRSRHGSRWLGLALGLVALALPAAAAEPVRDCADCPLLMPIPGGVLRPEGAPPVRVEPFLMARTEVTFDQWDACVADGGCAGQKDDHGWGRGDRPVINVTFHDARDYVRWLARRTGRAYRLPTEDEWEWAARGGTATAYWWGDDVGQGHANCRKCGSDWGGRMSAPVASFPANPYGLHDTAGNLWEWTTTCWAEDRAAPPEERDCAYRAAKGGAWYYIPSQARPANRARHAETLRSYTVGFRVAAPAE